jgi:hypothetical protein
MNAGTITYIVRHQCRSRSNTGLVAKSLQRKKLQLLANKRLQELARLIADRNRRGVVLFADEIAFVAACAMYFRKPPIGANTGLDVQSLRDWIRRVRLSGYHNCPIDRAHNAMARGIPLGGEKAAKAVALTADERKRLRITTIGAIDETREERRSADKLRRKYREAARRSRIAREAGRIIRPRSISYSRTRPWERETNPRTGKPYSRRTWERRRKAACRKNVPDNLSSVVGHELATTRPKRGEMERSTPRPRDRLPGSPSFAREAECGCTDAVQAVAGDEPASVGFLSDALAFLSMETTGGIQ